MVTANILYLARGLGEGLTNPHLRNPACYEISKRDSESATCDHGNKPSSSIKGWKDTD